VNESLPDTDDYARFAKRDLDRMSWLAPLVNNGVGDALIHGGNVVEDVGYSEKGRRFSEAEYGKPIRTLDDVRKYGYWFVGRRYDPDVMREALRRQQDGYYYSFFSNQCQDWADRLKRGAERVERERGIAHPRRRARMDADPRVLPTEPASIGMGLVALALGAGGFLAPVIAGGAFTVFIGVLLVAAGVSHVIYGAHARDWRNFLPELLTALIHFATAGLLLIRPLFGRMAGSAVIAAALGVHGGMDVFLGLFSRPRSHGTGKLLAGILMLSLSGLVLARWPVSGERLLGAAVGLSLLVGGISTVWLDWKTRTSRHD
jgi:uncharacterized membrane protein HdeD (DUF308 family)